MMLKQKAPNPLFTKESDNLIANSDPKIAPTEPPAV
ncbi:MAG: hypothetical protein CM15mP126_2430 [Gammaproteobacteria bacterium]|nr:MAG: hypothetical protein CM15mP126_2430 [Gammaproteobacteria bacterium]